MSSSEYKVVNVDFSQKFTAQEIEDGKPVKINLIEYAARAIAHQIIEEGLGEVEKDYDISRHVTTFNTRIRVLVKK